MRLVKTIGLVVSALLATVVLFGTTAASADVLCKANENPCAEKNIYPEEGGFTFRTPTVVLTSGTFSVTCEGVYSGRLLRDLGAGQGQEVSVDTVQYNNCTGSCTGAIPLGLSWIGILRAGPPATLSVMQRFRLTGCPGGVKCGYEAEETVLAFTGGKGYEAGEPALLKANEVKFTRDAESSKLFCPATLSMKAEFEATEPGGGVWLAAEP